MAFINSMCSRKAVHFQGRTTDATNLVEFLGLAQQFDIIIYRCKILGVQLLGKARIAVQIAGLVQISLVQLQDLLVHLPLLLGIALQGHLIEQVHQVQRVDSHARQALPVVGATIRHDAAAHAIGHLVEQRPHAADQSLQGIFRVGNAMLRPEGMQQLGIGHGTAPVKHQKLHQRSALAGLADRVFNALFIDINEEAPHHRYPHGIRHVANPPFQGLNS